jgi:hypothetical protein
VNLAEQQLVMQLYDEELPEEQTRLLQRRLAVDDEWRGVFEGLEQVGDLVRAMADRDATGAEAIVDHVMQRIDGLQAGEPGSGAPAVIRRFPTRSVAAGLAAAVALAAAVTLVLRAGRTPDEGSAQVASLSGLAPSVGTGPAAMPSVGPRTPFLEAAAGVPAVAIEAVDFGPRNGTIFMVGFGESTMPVVWVMDEPPASGVRMEPL